VEEVHISIGLLHLVALGLVITVPRTPFGSPRAGRVSNAVGLGRLRCRVLSSDERRLDAVSDQFDAVSFSVSG
jgi:hypothetical protein